MVVAELFKETVIQIERYSHLKKNMANYIIASLRSHASC
jgi:hypothetical protein